MKIEQNINLSQYTTLRLGGVARYFIIVSNREDFLQAVSFARSQRLPVFVLGGGSNLVVSDGSLDKVVVKMENKGIDVFENGDEVLLYVKAGEVWDELVSFSVLKGLSGLEALSLIPGTVGASPVQNIGAYGMEVSKVIKEVIGFNLESSNFETLSNEICQFSYRDSIFKKSLKNKFIIESVVFRLSKQKPEVSSYSGIKDLFEKNKIQYSELTDLELIRKTIIEVRNQKLPDPKELANVGSFFGNVFVKEDKLKSVLAKFSDIPYFKEGDLFKIPTGWLIEKAGFKGQKFGLVGVYPKHALVLVNYGSEKTKDILDLAEKIKSKIKNDFDLDIEIEPEVI